MLRLLKIQGHSLYPDFTEGEFILSAKVPFPSGRIRVGDVIVFQQPGYGKLVKRVSQVLNGGHAFEVRGTQVESTDSRNFGPVQIENVTGKVIWHIRRSDRQV
jgi:signal peptidase I